MVIGDLIVDELEGIAALALLGCPTFLDEQFSETLGHLESAFGIRIAVGDLDQFRPRTVDLGAVLDLLHEPILLDRCGMGFHPATRDQRVSQDLAPKNDLAGHSSTI